MKRFELKKPLHSLRSQGNCSARGNVKNILSSVNQFFRTG